MPGHQQAIDLLPGWNCSFPGELDLRAGPLGLFTDERILWAIETFGTLKDKTILEVGPLEGMHTYMLNRERPRRIDAVEANRLSYLRCLITSQILGLDRAHFFLGDAQQWLETRHETYDLIIASGVLYHMRDPVGFLKAAAQRSDALFLWTHFFLDEAMKPDDPRRWPFSGKVVVRTVGNVEVRCHERSYKNTAGNSSFCGGMSDRHYWLDRDDILSALAVLGYQQIDIMGEDLAHPGGPCFSLLARRTTIDPGPNVAVQPPI